MACWARALSSRGFVALLALGGCDGSGAPAARDIAGDGGRTSGGANAGGRPPSTISFDRGCGAPASGGAAGALPDGASPADDRGEGDGEDVVTMGDSYMSYLTADLQRSLAKVSGRRYRSYAEPGTFVLTGEIPEQYESAVTDDPDIQTVIMSGGGNDILASQCDGACGALIDQVATRLAELRRKMGEDGVRDVIVVGYGYPTGQRGPALREAVDYYRQLMVGSCRDDGAPPRCHYVDAVDVLKCKISGDGVHPTADGHDALAQLVWARMRAEGVRR